jgi:hypothetical protein|tara:strand:+ start:208781 stop:209215 length:435 start_codon:yes stop_codon:yes gene_type:complete
MKYPGFCAKYGAGKMFGLGFAFGPVAGLCVEAATEATTFVEAASAGLYGGYFGFSIAVIAHEALNLYCSDKGYGISRGGRLVKTTQAASYGLVLASIIAAQQTELIGVDEEAPTPEGAKTSLQMQQKTQSIQDTVRAHGLTLVA